MRQIQGWFVVLGKGPVYRSLHCQVDLKHAAAGEGCPVISIHANARGTRLREMHSEVSIESLCLAAFVLYKSLRQKLPTCESKSMFLFRDCPAAWIARCLQGHLCNLAASRLGPSCVCKSRRSKQLLESKFTSTDHLEWESTGSVLRQQR